MSEIPTIKVQTGPDTFIIVNTEDYEAFKFMEYAPKIAKKPEPVYTEQEKSEPVITTKRNSSKTEE